LKRALLVFIPAHEHEGPNDQNSDRGIETNSSASVSSEARQVRTTRIPTEELKLAKKRSATR